MSSPFMPAPQNTSVFSTVPATTARKPRLEKPTSFVPEHVSLVGMQKCLEDRRSSFVTVNSTFSGELELESRPHERFFVLEQGYFTLFSHDHSAIKFSYRSRNAVMARLWKAGTFADMSTTKFVEVDGLWQLEQLPVMCFVFGQDADTLRSDYLIDGNTIHEYYEKTAPMDMAELATVALDKGDVCISHFFVVNRGKRYWAVGTKDSSICYAFGPSTKTRTISRLANGSMSVQALIDEEQSQASVEARADQSSEFKIYDCNGEEVVEGDRFALEIPSDRYEDDDECERQTMFDDRDWVYVLDSAHNDPQSAPIFLGSMDHGDVFELAIIDGIAYLTAGGRLVQIEDYNSSPGLVVLPQVPSKHNRVHITPTDDCLIALSRWGATVPIILEWMKAACGVFCIYNRAGYLDINDSAKLRIIKV
ncbi:hypothetical protein FBU31_005447 [Coemansia sp. 'formosensis']|nr:hypothetical protein FBU31_005447 [Coemansia sp. 'formosensis']